MTNTRYTLADAGCYVDGARGIYAVDRIVQGAIDHGMDEPYGCSNSDCPRCTKGDKVAGDGSHTEWANCYCSGEYEDEATDFMNERFRVEGCYWGRNDNGDWGLWSLCECAMADGIRRMHETWCPAFEEKVS